MLDACIQNFFRVSTLYMVVEGRAARKFRKGCTVLRGNREITEKYEYCSAVPRTFVRTRIVGRPVTRKKRRSGNTRNGYLNSVISHGPHSTHSGQITSLEVMTALLKNC